MKKRMLFEIGTEEIPSRFIPQALEDIAESLTSELAAQRIDCTEVRRMGTPRRLTVSAELDERQQPLETERIGPPRSVAFDDEGRPTRAAVGFAKRECVQVEDLAIVETEKGAYVCVRQREEGRRTHEVLVEILPRLISSVPFPKSMRWSDLDIRFARPIHWIVALFDGEVIPFVVGKVASGSVTRGHRFLHPDPITVIEIDDYREKLRHGHVIVDPSERKEMIRREIQAAAEEAGGRCQEDEALVEEVTYLVEYPVAVLGSFDEEYLALPRDVLITAMQHHQKYFPVVDGTGRLVNHFVAVSNAKARDMRIIRQGNERVLRARLADAQFFFAEDQKVTLEKRVEELKDVIFQTKLGTSYEKVMRFQELAVWLADELGYNNTEIVARGAYLCKADLVSAIVGEFPQLQGIMGREYALRSGEKLEVAQVIYEHYLPRFAGDALPSSAAGDVVSMADKMDTIAGCFGVGLIPSGTSDPFALRRQALGIINIILGKEYRVSLRKVVDTSLKLLGKRIERPREETDREVMAFLRGRFVNLLVSQGYPADLVDAALAAQMDDLVDARARIDALARFRQRSEFEPLAVAFKRVANILREVDQSPETNSSLFETRQEGELHKRYLEIREVFSQLVGSSDYEGAMAALARLRKPVDDFFDHVLVMVEDKALRDNRLALLGEIYGLFSQVADFSQVGVGDLG